MAARAVTSPPKLPLYIVWNFFPPMPPSPDFPTFVGGWRTKAGVVRASPGFLVTQLHRNLDPKGKWVHLARKHGKPLKEVYIYCKVSISITGHPTHPSASASASRFYSFVHKAEERNKCLVVLHLSLEGRVGRSELFFFSFLQLEWRLKQQNECKNKQICIT